MLVNILCGLTGTVVGSCKLEVLITERVCVCMRERERERERDVCV